MAAFGSGSPKGAAAVHVRRRRARIRAALLASVVAVLAAGIPGADAQDAGAEEMVARGGSLYQATCAACHGTRAEGGSGPDVRDGPALDDVDIAYVDLTLRTGRMPIAAPEVGVHEEQLDDVQREAVVAYLDDRFALPGAIPEVRTGDAARGQELYVRNCAACHGAAATGGISGADVRVPPLVGTDDVAIFEAARVGPFEMPAFDEQVLSDEDLYAVVGYLGEVDQTPRTAAGVREVDQIGSGLFALAFALPACVVLLVAAHARRLYPREPGGIHEAPPFGPRR